MTHGLGRVLVVDDDEVIRRLIAVNLQLEGFDVETAVDGQDCLERVTEIDPDVITLDVMMPRLDGWETAVQLRKSPQTAHIKVVLITARAQEDDKSRGGRVGADAYLTKPFDPNEMIRVVRPRRRRSAVSPQPALVITAGLRRAIVAAAGRQDADPLLRPGRRRAVTRPACPSGSTLATPARRPRGSPAGSATSCGSPGPRSPGPASSPSPSPTPPWPAWRSGSPTPDRPARKATRWPAAPSPRPAGRRSRVAAARAALAAELTVRLATAAGAIMSTERTPVPAPAPPPPGPVAEAIHYAGPDAVRFALARMPPSSRPPEAAVLARQVLANPAYAVRYAHTAAAAVLRWAAALEIRPAGFKPRLLAEPGELALLDALSWLPERVAAAARRGRPDEFAGYLAELAARTIDTMSTTSFRKIPDITSERLWLADAARTGLAAGLGLLGIAAPPRL